MLVVVKSFVNRQSDFLHIWLIFSAMLVKRFQCLKCKRLHRHPLWDGLSLNVPLRPGEKIFVTISILKMLRPKWEITDARTRFSAEPKFFFLQAWPAKTNRRQGQCRLTGPRSRQKSRRVGSIFISISKNVKIVCPQLFRLKIRENWNFLYFPFFQIL